jgi:hypothetical protein
MKVAVLSGTQKSYLTGFDGGNSLLSGNITDKGGSAKSGLVVDAYPSS